jgi:hypothetical protein
MIFMTDSVTTYSNIMEILSLTVMVMGEQPSRELAHDLRLVISSAEK